MTTKPSLGNVYIRGILSVGVPESVEKPNGVVFRCSIRGRRPEIPAWMCDRSACARVRVAAGAHANLAALVHRVALRKDRAKCKNIAALVAIIWRAVNTILEGLQNAQSSIASVCNTPVSFGAGRSTHGSVTLRTRDALSTMAANRGRSRCMVIGRGAFSLA